MAIKSTFRLDEEASFITEVLKEARFASLRIKVLNLLLISLRLKISGGMELEVLSGRIREQLGGST